MIGSMIQGEGIPMMMRNMMQGMMHQKGIMSEDCMQSSTKMMGDKGMDMNGMNKMKK